MQQVGASTHNDNAACMHAASRQQLNVRSHVAFQYFLQGVLGGSRAARKGSTVPSSSRVYLMKSFLRTRMSIVAKKPVSSSTVTQLLMMENQWICNHTGHQLPSAIFVGHRDAWPLDSLQTTAVQLQEIACKVPAVHHFFSAFAGYGGL